MQIMNLNSPKGFFFQNGFLVQKEAFFPKTLQIINLNDGIS